MAKYGPQEDAHDLFLEQTFMISTFLAAMGYGALLTLAQKGHWLTVLSEQACNL